MRYFDVAGIRRRGVGIYTGPAAYVTGGDPVDSRSYGKAVEVVHYEHATDGTDIYILSYDYGYPTGLIKWFVPSTGNEVAADVDLSGFTARFEVVGL
jgi:hypothetical protein